METLVNIGKKPFVFAALKNIICIFRYSFLCLHCVRCVVPVSVRYRSCLVTVCMKALQNG
jgi:hypothetical protein